MWVGDSHQPICVPANSAKVVSGKTKKIRITSMHLDLFGVMMVLLTTTPIGKLLLDLMHVSHLVMNTNSYNIWIHQSLLTVDVVEADYCPWDYQSSLSCEDNEVKVTFHSDPCLEVQEEILSSSVSNSAQSNSDSKEQGERSKLDLDLSLTVLILTSNW